VVGVLEPGLLLVVKVDWPMTVYAGWPFVNGALYSSTRLLLPSATQILPDGSNAMSQGLFSPVWVVAGPLPPKFDWPTTIDAASPVEIGAAYSNTRLLLTSETQRLPDESNATSAGLFSPVCPEAPVLLVKVDCPNTVDAASLLENGVLYSSTRLLCTSTTHMLPEESNAIPAGAFSAVCDRPGLVPVEGFVWPMAMDAASPFVNGVVYSSTRLLAWSATQRLPE